MTIHSNLMTSNKFQKTEIVTLSDPIGEFCPHLLDTYIITYFLNCLLFITALWIITSERSTYEY